MKQNYNKQFKKNINLNIGQIIINVLKNIINLIKLTHTVY